MIRKAIDRWFSLPLRWITLACIVLIPASASGPVYWGNASSENGEVCLALPAEVIDWRALAIQSLGAERFAHPSPDVLRSGLEPERGNSMSIPFQSPVPEGVRNRSWLVLYRGGAAPVIPTVLRGTVTYFFDSTLTLTQEPAAGGTACAPGLTPQAAAFYVSGAAVRALSLDQVSLGGGARDTLTLTVDGRMYRFPRPSFAFPKVLHVTLFLSDTNERMALVEWDPGDGSNCQSSFSLVTLAAVASRPPLENGYGCDL